MQATLREFEDWLEDSVPDAVMIGYEKALAKLEECLPYEDTLVGSTSGSESLSLYTLISALIILPDTANHEGYLLWLYLKLSKLQTPGKDQYLLFLLIIQWRGL